LARTVSFSKLICETLRVFKGIGQDS